MLEFAKLGHHNCRQIKMKEWVEFCITHTDKDPHDLLYDLFNEGLMDTTAEICTYPKCDDSLFTQHDPRQDMVIDHCSMCGDNHHYTPDDFDVWYWIPKGILEEAVEQLKEESYTASPFWEAYQEFLDDSYDIHMDCFSLCKSHLALKTGTDALTNTIFDLGCGQTQGLLRLLNNLFVEYYAIDKYPIEKDQD
ncbi:MAG: hypothetical protein AAGM67_16405, partial [Bacteroidota bacterium]